MTNGFTDKVRPIAEMAMGLNQGMGILGQREQERSDAINELGMWLLAAARQLDAEVELRKSVCDGIADLLDKENGWISLILMLLKNAEPDVPGLKIAFSTDQARAEVAKALLSLFTPGIPVEQITEEFSAICGKRAEAALNQMELRIQEFRTMRKKEMAN